jgi:hypothetical protein
VKLVDQGKREEAAAELKKQVGSNRSQAAKYKIPEAAPASVTVELEAQADEIQEKGLDSRGRKSMVTDSFQYRNQQQKQ